MSRSMPLHANDKEMLTQLLRGFLAGEYQLEEIQDRLRGYLDVDFSSAPARREINNNVLDGEIEIELDPQYVRAMLEAYLTQRVNGLELSNWAAFIFMSQVF